MDCIVADGKRFIDEHSRERIFNGVNIGRKNEVHVLLDSQINFYPKYLKEMGFNLVRLGINWAALQKEPGTYEKAEFDSIMGFMDECAKYGVYVFLDMHQDLYGTLGRKSKPAIGKKPWLYPGDGAPQWASLTDNHKFAPPYMVWAQGYFMDKSVHACFDHFWHNDTARGKGLLDHYAGLWQELARRFGTHPAFFGFDFLNEPFPGSDGGKVFNTIVASAVKKTVSSDIDKKELLKALAGKNPIPTILKLYDSEQLSDILKPAYKYIERFDKEYYAPFMRKMTKAVRQVTDKGIILMENSYYSNIGIPFSAPPVSVDGKREPNQAFTPHAYDLMVDTPMYKYADNERVGAIFAQRKYEQDNNLDMPVVVGEWGGFCNDPDKKWDWLNHIEYLLDLFDSYKWSHTYYSFNAMIIDTPLNDVLCRPYPIAVTGSIISYRHDRQGNCFTLSYDQAKNYDVPTEIFAHKPIASIETDGEYEIESLGNKTSVIKLKTNIGRHTIKIEFN